MLLEKPFLQVIRTMFTFQTISIDLIKKSFSIYGVIERIELFRHNTTNRRFTHVTFKESRATYLALIDYKQNVSGNFDSIRPAYAHQQPDNTMDTTKSSFYNLPDKCLLDIFRKLDNLTLATLSVVCKKMCQLLRDHIFTKKTYASETSNDAGVINALITANRILQCRDPEAFHIKISRNLTKSHKWPMISVDFDYAEKSRISIDMNFLQKKWLCELESISKLINSVHIRYSVYDNVLPCKSNNTLWPNAKVLIISGFSMKKSIPHFSSVIDSLPKLEDLFIRNLFFTLNIKDYCQGKHLRNIVYENCSFNADVSKQIGKVVDVVKQKKNNFPLIMKFDRIQFFKTDCFEECYHSNFNEMCNKHNHCNQRNYQPHVQRRRKFISWNESSYDWIKMVNII